MIDPASDEDDAISLQAADYFQRRRFWDWTDADQAELDAWLAQSLWHRAAYLRLEGIAAQAGKLAAHRPRGLIRRVDVRNLYRTFVVPVLAAASIVLGAIVGYPYVLQLFETPIHISSTDVGGRTLLSFPDQTQIELNTDTVLRYRMSTVERTVWLDKGEAWFHVRHNAANPFTVIIGTHRLTDIGTEFDVRRGTSGVEVALLNGRAALATEGAQTATLAPGDDAVATRLTIAVTHKTQQQLADELAWRSGLLVFREARLADAIAEFNRYTQTKFVIADPAIAGLKFSADIRADNYDGFLLVVQTMLGIRADRQGDTILLAMGDKQKHRKAPHTNESR